MIKYSIKYVPIMKKYSIYFLCTLWEKLRFFLIFLDWALFKKALKDMCLSISYLQNTQIIDNEKKNYKVYRGIYKEDFGDYYIIVLKDM